MEALVKDRLSYHETRFPFDQRRETVWQTLCADFFNPRIGPEFHVLELGAGYGHFINNVRCKSRSAVDQWPKMLDYLHPGVRGYLGSVTDLSFLPDHSVDFALASNLFEHLSQSDFALALIEIRKKLKHGGTLNILQPNYRLAYKEYFDDYTHISVYSDLSLCDFLTANGFEILESVPGLLPFSIKASKLPVWPWLVKLYLASPWKPFAKQMFVCARPVR
jgi:SAM-dependent methyltransferase